MTRTVLLAALLGLAACTSTSGDTPGAPDALTRNSPTAAGGSNIQD